MKGNSTMDEIDEREELAIRLLEAIGTLRLQLEDTEEAENLQKSRQIIKQINMETNMAGMVELPSAFQIGDIVVVNFLNANQLPGCIVMGVRFTPECVTYDIAVPFGTEDYTILHDVNSMAVKRP